MKQAPLADALLYMLAGFVTGFCTLALMMAKLWNRLP